MDRHASSPTASRCRMLLSLLAVVLLSLFTAPSAGESVAPQHRVPLKVYFRAFCPACQWFVSDPLLELVRNEQFRNVVDLQLFPAAGMSEEKGELLCEGGALECTGHRLEVCMMEKDRHDVVKYLGTIACMEGDESGRTGDWSEKMKNCLTPEERAVVDECYKTKADGILRNMIHKHNSGSVEWMPFTVVEDKVLGSATQGVGLGELQASVCSAYKGPKQFYPEACAKLVGDQHSVAVNAHGAAQAPANPNAAAAEVAADAQQPAHEDDDEIELELKGDGTDNDAAAPVVPATGKVRLEVFWRAFCPGCMAFIGKPLLELLRDQEFRDSIDFRPVPAAGTYLDDAGKFVCSMGLVECMGHKWMSCAIDLFPKVDEQIEYLACLESKDNKGMTWSAVVARCFPGDNTKKMRECYDTRSDELLKKHVAQREKVDVLWVPYVLVNGVPIGDARHGIGFKQLSDEVCKGYSGPMESRPSACRPKRLRAEEDATTNAATEPVIKPCPPKKDVKGGSTAPVTLDDDAPGIGARIESDIPQPNGNGNGDALAAANKNGRALDSETDGAARAATGAGSSDLQSVLVPGAVFVVVGVLAFRFYSGDHKKDA